MSMGGGRKYGVQVGSETYSLILTPEDWEKRRQDRENAKKLSLANNRRRRAIDDRKRVAEARENRKRELELFKRRQRQIEATERYQRFHVGVNNKRQPTTGNDTQAPDLEEVLQKLKGGYGDGVSSSPSTTNIIEKSNSGTEVTQTSSAPITETKQPTLDRMQWQNMKDYAEDLKRQFLSQHAQENLSSDPKILNIKDENKIEDSDGQDSLHGSSISTSSQPSYSSVTVTKQDHGTTKMQQLQEEAQNSAIGNRSPTTAWKDNTSQNYNYQTHRQAISSLQYDLHPQSPHAPTIRGSENGVMCRRDGQTGRITYYVKAYRPWSANVSNKSFQNTFSHPENSPAALRPSSSDVSRKNIMQSDFITKGTYRTSNVLATSTHAPSYSPHNTVFTSQNEQKKHEVSQHNFKFNSTVENQVKHDPHVNNALGSTTATPFSSIYQQPSKPSINIVQSSPSHDTTVKNATESSGDKHSGNFQIISVPSSTSTSDSSISTIPLENSFLSETVNEKVEEQSSPQKQLKGILRRHSKYESSATSKYTLSHPSYQSAGLARQKWLNGITAEADKKEQRVRSAEAKSVRWHQVQYNDGTSSNLDLHEGSPPPAPVPKPVTVFKAQPAPKSSPRGKTPKKPPTARPKTAPSRAMKGGKVRAGGRRLKPAKEPQINIVPHPPQQKKSPKLSMSTVINYSIDPSENTVPIKEFKPIPFNTTPLRQRSAKTNKRMSPITHNKIVFHRKGKSENGEAVTMSTLKSRGNDTKTNDVDDDGILVNHGNQVTIKVSSSKPISSTSTTTRRNSTDGRIPLNGTPTDEEIEMLWDKVRSYLAWTRNRSNNPQITKKIHGSPERKVAWSATNDTPSKQVSANIISIDGGIFSKQAREEANSFNGYKIQPQPVQYERYGIGKSRKLAYSPTVPYEYGYNANQTMQTSMREKLRGTVTSERISHPSSAPVRRTAQLTDSIKTFRLVEALIEQNVPEEQILNALNSLQSATREV